MKTNINLHSPEVRSALAKSIIASRWYARKYESDNIWKRRKGDNHFTLGYFVQSIDNVVADLTKREEQNQ